MVPTGTDRSLMSDHSSVRQLKRFNSATTTATGPTSSAIKGPYPKVPCQSVLEQGTQPQMAPDEQPVKKAL